jgi:hypothetical protein
MDYRTDTAHGASNGPIPELAARCMRKTAHTAQSIKEFTYEVKDSLMALDPDITGIGLLWDWDDRGEDRLRSIIIDRKSAPMMVRRSQASHPDRELLSLGREFEAAWAEEEALAAAHKLLDQEPVPDPWEGAYHATQAIVERIQTIPAHTLAGLKVKARAVQWCYAGDEIYLTDAQTTDVRLAQDIIADLVRIGGSHE